MRRRRISSATRAARAAASADDRRVIGDLRPRHSAICPLEHQSRGAAMKTSSALKSGALGPDARERPLEALEARAGVQQADEARPSPGEVRREEQRVVLADDAVGRVRAVEPVHADADHRIVDRTELLDRLVRLLEEARHAIRLACPSFSSARSSCVVASATFGSASSFGFCAPVARPEQRDLLVHVGSRSSRHGIASPPRGGVLLREDPRPEHDLLRRGVLPARSSSASSIASAPPVG